MAASSMLAMRGVASAVLCSTLTAPPGAVYLYGDAPADSSFNGNAFFIDGHDYTLAFGPGSAPPIVGLATHTEANAQQARDSLAQVQADNVQGLGYDPGPPIVPSVFAVPGPDSAALDQFVTDLLAAPHVESSVATINVATFVDFGSHGSPHVTHLTGQGAGVVEMNNGNVDGAGILIVEDSLTVQGNFTYDGLVIVRGPLSVTGSLLVFGSVWTTQVSLLVAGSTIMVDSAEGLTDATEAAGSTCATPVCGDGVLTEGEECDDRNTVDGDCCSATCTLEPPMVPCADDGNACTDDHCDGAGTCVHPNSGAACDDGDACTAGDLCVAAACVGTPIECGACMQCDSAAGCVGAPALDCREPLVPSTSRLGLTDSDDPRRDRLSWRWRTSDGVARTDFGDPLAATDYTLCLFGGPAAGSVLLRAVVPAGTGCGTSCGWNTTSRGFRYRDRLARSGISRIDLTARSPGNSVLKVAGMGDALHMPALSFPVAAPLVLQLRAGGGSCWQTTFPMGNLGFAGRRLNARGGQP